ncbi:LPS export ABC transporter periplasmic protein LptC [Ferrimonas gelatinilytica]|uniref:Lipopolysaccharide export system protein LptC n=1 Tax=Ferrimonas gelatinilytica TaxID=1255257 RepID=A0ABP9SGB3_9GAMM
MKRELLAGLLLLTMAAGLYWRSLNTGSDQTVLSPETEPDFIARSLRTRAYDSSGRLNAEIAADQMQHFQDDALTEFARPVYLLYPEGGDGVWKIQSEAGQLQQNRYLLLEQEVVVTAIEPGEPLQTIHTDQLALDLETMVMTTESMIRAEGNTFTLQARGLWADLNTNRIELKDRVSATYEVQ